MSISLTSHYPHKSTTHQPLQSPRAQIAQLEAKVARAETERDYAVTAYQTASAGEENAKAHCTLAQRANQDLVTRLHKITTKPKRVPVDNVFQGQKHGFLTAPEGKERHMAKVEAKRNLKADEKKAQEQAEKDQQIQDTKLRRLYLVADPMHSFGGTIASIKHARIDTLRDVAPTLGLDYEGVTKSDLYDGIVAHFELHPELKSHSRYAKLFSSRKASGSAHVHID